jgi:hypothetical protein
MITIASNGLDVQAIHPSRGAKYSPNLHRWLSARAQVRQLERMKVYQRDDGALFVGFVHDGDFIGARLMSVLCDGAKADSWCSPQGSRFTEVPDFWERYTRDGRCAIDTEHRQWFIGDETRWSVDGDTRRCAWCGNASQVLRRWTEAVPREAWKPAAA